MRGSGFEAMRITVQGDAQVKAIPQALRAKEKIDESESTRIRRFADYTGIYIYNCHLLEHEDDGMMGQFEVIT